MIVLLIDLLVDYLIDELFDWLFDYWINLLRAEAERMRMKASAYKQYGDAAILALVLEALPQIAAEVK